MTNQQPDITSSIGYNLRMELHALASILRNPQTATAAQLEILLRRLIRTGHQVLRAGPLPERPFAFADDQQSIGPGAILSEYAEAGTTSISHLVAQLDPTLLQELDKLVTLSDGISGVPDLPFTEPPSSQEIRLPLALVDDWTAIAKGNVGYSATRATVTSDEDTMSGTDTGSLSSEVLHQATIGLEAAHRLITRLGHTLPPRVSPTVDLHGVLAASTVADKTVAAAFALSYLAAESGLPTPTQLSILPIADCTQDGAWIRYSGIDTVRGQTTRDGMRCLWRDEDGWRIQSADGFDAESDTTLHGAAHLLWGEAWGEVTRRWALDALTDNSWELLHPAVPETDWLSEDGYPVVAVDPVDSLAAWFTGHQRARVILSGARNSGKSVSARLIAKALGQRGWNTITIAPTRQLLPRQLDILPAIVENALRATRNEPGTPTLVVLENLLALENGNIGEILAPLGHLDIGVLALTRYVDSTTTAWNPEGTVTLFCSDNDDELRTLAQRLTTAHPGVYGPTETARIDASVAICRGDREILTEVLRERDIEDCAEPADTLHDKLLELRESLDETTRPALYRLAAVSAIDDAVPASHVEALPNSILATIGVRTHGGLVHIGSRVKAEALLDAANPKDLSDKIVVHTADYLLRLLHDDNTGRLASLFRHYSTYLPDPLNDLLGRPDVKEALRTWAGTGRPPTVMRILHICYKATQLQWIAAAVMTAATRLRGTEDLTVRELATSLKALWNCGLQLDLAPTGCEELLDWIVKTALDEALDRPSRVSDRYDLSEWLLKCSRFFTSTAIVADHLDRRAERLIGDINPQRGMDLIYVRRLGQLLKRDLESRYSETGVLDRSCRVDQAVQGLLKHYPEYDMPLAAVLSWMSLRLHFEGSNDWNSLIDRYGTQIRFGLGRTDPTQVSVAFRDLSRSNNGMCTRLFNRIDLSGQLVALVKSGSPEAAAILISTIRNIHGKTVKSMLYRQEDERWVADRVLVRHVAKTIVELDDVRGAGRLLSNVSRTDDLYCDTMDRFGYWLSCELGVDFAKAALNGKHPPAVVYHLLRGLWEARADYRDDLEDFVLNLVDDSIRAQRGVARRWGPQLAILLISDDYFGQSFLTRLSERLDASLLCRRMLNTNLDTQSLLHTHRLARAVAPDIGEAFAHRIKIDRAINDQLRAPMAQAIEKSQIIAETLRLAELPDPETMVINTLKSSRPGQDWSQQLVDIRRPGVLTRALRQLRFLDRDLAAETVRRIAMHRLSRSTRLMELLSGNIDQPNLIADLLETMELIIPGSGRDGLDQLRRRNDRWYAFCETFSYEQDPIQQGVVGRKLLRVGFTQSRERRPWMSTLVNNRWTATIRDMASPWAIEQILNLCYSWDPAWGEALGTQINRRWLLSRIGLAMRHDLRVMPQLVYMLWLCGREDLAKDIVLNLMPGEPGQLADALGLRSSSELLRSLRRTHLEIEGFPTAVAGLVAEHLGRPLAVDIGGHWAEIGWAAQAIRDWNEDDSLPERPPALKPNTSAFPAQLSWAMTWLPATDYNSHILEESVETFQRRPFDRKNPNLSCMSLIAAAHAGQVPGTVSLQHDWAEATDAGPELVTLLCRESLGNTAIAEHLGTSNVADNLRKLLNEEERPDLITAGCVEELAAQLDRLRPSSPASEPAEGNLGF